MNRLFSFAFAVVVLSILVIKMVHTAAASTPAPGAISFNGDWSAGLTGAQNAFDHVLETAPDRITVVTDIIRRFPRSVRVEVREGDGASYGDFSLISGPLGAMAAPIYENESSGTQYYGFSIRLNDPFPDTKLNSWAVMWEVHTPDIGYANPSILLEPYNDVAITQKWSITLHAGDYDNNTDPTKYLIHTYELSNPTLNKGHWTDFIIKVKYAKDFTGTVDVWRRDEGVADFTNVLSIQNVPTLSFKSNTSQVAPNHYMNIGYYRGKDTPTAIAWIDGLTRGSTFDAVLNTFAVIKVGDLNADGKVDIYDYNIFVGNYGKTGAHGFVPSDLDKNGKVDIFDYNLLVANYGR